MQSVFFCCIYYRRAHTTIGMEQHPLRARMAHTTIHMEQHPLRARMAHAAVCMLYTLTDGTGAPQQRLLI